LGELQQALEGSTWDGDWYLRAFYDDGSPLGSSQNLECRIDSIAQSWGVISRAADPERAQRAMQSVLSYLLKADEQLLLLFVPPFDKTSKDPGYIKGYPPGIRENGGQYTHAAIWAAWAFAKLGDGDQAEALFRLLNPIYHGDTAQKIERYRVEPYVIAADVYGTLPHTGRGGWTWYTGSSGWMYRLGVEAILGLYREGEFLRIDPCIPRAWPHYDLTYRYGQSVYHIRVENPKGVSQGVTQMLLDGQLLPDARVPLLTQRHEYQVVIRLG
jgi:cyclic beta-1,2-glucan synthetase